MALNVRSNFRRQGRPAGAGASTAKLTAPIVEWQAAKGFGFLSFEGHRVFVHHRDFVVKHKQPEVGDVVEFRLGNDTQGRICAQQVEHRNDGGRIRLWHLALLLPLLVAPGFALSKVGARYDWRPIAGCAVGLSLIAYVMYWFDKQRARRGEWRISESTLQVVALLGGWPGAFLAQRHLHHKTSKMSFQVLFLFIIALNQFIAVDYLRDWTMAHAANAEFKRLTMSVPK